MKSSFDHFFYLWLAPTSFFTFIWNRWGPAPFGSIELSLGLLLGVIWIAGIISNLLRSDYQPFYYPSLFHKFFARSSFWLSQLGIGFALYSWQQQNAYQTILFLFGSAFLIWLSLSIPKTALDSKSLWLFSFSIDSVPFQKVQKYWKSSPKQVHFQDEYGYLIVCNFENEALSSEFLKQAEHFITANKNQARSELEKEKISPKSALRYAPWPIRRQALWRRVFFVLLSIAWSWHWYSTWSATQTWLGLLFVNLPLWLLGLGFCNMLSRQPSSWLYRFKANKHFLGKKRNRQLFLFISLPFSLLLLFFSIPNLLQLYVSGAEAQTATDAFFLLTSPTLALALLSDPTSSFSWIQLDQTFLSMRRYGWIEQQKRSEIKSVEIYETQSLVHVQDSIYQLQGESHVIFRDLWEKKEHELEQ